MKVGRITAKTEVYKAEFKVTDNRVKLGQFIRAKLNKKWVLCQVGHLKYKAQTGKDKKKKPLYLGIIINAVYSRDRSLYCNQEAHSKDSRDT